MRGDRFGTFLAIASLALAVLVVLLAAQNRGLKKELAKCGAGPAMPADALDVGDTLGSIPVFDAGGNRSMIDVSAGVHVLLIYSSTCPACEQTLPTWNRWVEGGSLDGANVLAIRTDPPAAGATSAPSPAALRLPIHLADRSGDDPLRRMYAVPCTLVVGPGGKVRAAVYGVPTDDDAEKVQEALRS